MNRRAFLSAALIALATPRIAIATTPVATPTFATRAFETIDPAATDPGRTVTRVDRLTATSRPFPASLDELVELGHFEYFGAIRGEYWVGEFDEVQAPNDLPSPAMFVDFESSAGIVGFREEHTLGMFETGAFRWTIQATGGARDERIRLVTELAKRLAGRPAGGTPTPAGSDLSSLLPDADDFPVPVRIAEAPPAN